MLDGLIIIIFLFFLGLISSTFCIVVGLRAPLKNKEFINMCNHCDHRFKWYELLPIFSFFLNKGECRYCHKDLSLWYPFLELVSGLLFSFSFMIYDFSYEMFAMITLVLLSVVIFVSDFKYFIILDGPLFLASFFILALKWIFFGFETFLISLCSGILILIFMLVIRHIGNIIFKQESLGGGDVKLAMFFGFMLGIKLSIVSLVVGSFLAFPYAVYCSLTDKQKEIPFGPFLISGLFFVFVFMSHINSFLAIIF